VTNPSVDTAQSGDAVDAVRTLQSELSGNYSEIRSAEIQLTEAILTAHAVTVSGRTRLQDVQRQLIEAINNPVTALDTPAGERHFLLFLRSKIAEIQDIVDTGALTDEDHAKLTRALGSGYLLSTPDSEDAPSAPSASSGGRPMADQAAGVMPAVGSAPGALPQAAQGAATAPAQGASGLAGAASPLAGLAAGLLDRSDEPGPLEDRVGDRSITDEDTDVDESRDTDTETGEDSTDDRPSEPQPPGDREPERGPAQTRPAGSR
jgi:Domain of unknown function (DUF4226)